MLQIKFLKSFNHEEKGEILTPVTLGDSPWLEPSYLLRVFARELYYPVYLPKLTPGRQISLLNNFFIVFNLYNPQIRQRLTQIDADEKRI